MAQDPEKSKFVTSVAWTFIAFSALFTFVATLQNIFFQVFLKPSGILTTPDAPPLWIYMDAYLGWLLLAILLLSISMLVSSVGLLKRSNLARLCFIGFLILGIAVQFVGLGLQYFIYSLMQDFFHDAAVQGGPDMSIMFLAGGIVNALWTVGISFLFGRLAKKLLSAPIAAEFRR